MADDSCMIIEEVKKAPNSRNDRKKIKLPEDSCIILDDDSSSNSSTANSSNKNAATSLSRIITPQKTKETNLKGIDESRDENFTLLFDDDFHIDFVKESDKDVSITKTKGLSPTKKEIQNNFFSSDNDSDDDIWTQGSTRVSTHVKEYKKSPLKTIRSSPYLLDDDYGIFYTKDDDEIDIVANTSQSKVPASKKIDFSWDDDFDLDTNSYDHQSSDHNSPNGKCVRTEIQDDEDFEQLELLQKDLNSLRSTTKRNKKIETKKNGQVSRKRGLSEEARKSAEALKKSRQAIRENQAACRATENCVAIIDQRIMDLINDSHGDLFRALFDENNCRYRLSQSISLPNSITWVRIRKERAATANESNVPHRGDESFSSSQPANFSMDTSSLTSHVREFEEPESRITVVLSGTEFVDMLESFYFKYNCGASVGNDAEKSIDEFIESIKSKSDSTSVTIIVFNLAAHFKKARLKKNREFQSRFKEKFGSSHNQKQSSKTKNKDEMSREIPRSQITDYAELRKAKNMLMFKLNKLHPDWRIGIWFLDNTDDVVQSICRQTISIAKAPHKERSRRQDGIDWAIDADRANKPVDPANSEEDLKVLWINQLQQFTSITPSIAQQIAMRYPSPMSLINAYSRCADVNEASKLLTSITYRRNGRQNSVSQTASELIYNFFSSNDPDRVLCTA